MSQELALPAWSLPELTAADCGPWADFPRYSDEEKAALWAQYGEGRAPRVPVMLSTNNRVALLDPRIDAGGLTFQQVFNDARAMLLAQLRWAYLCRRVYGLFCDAPTGLPDAWEIGIDFQNVYDAASLGAPVHFHANSVPETHVILTDDRKRAIFDVDLDRPLEVDFLRRAFALSDEVAALAERSTFCGRPIRVSPYRPLGTDGPLTVGMNLRGPAILTDLRRDPDYARELFDFIVTFALRRSAALLERWPEPPLGDIWLADDSIAVLSVPQYREFVLPAHRKWYEGLDPGHKRRRCIHLCGDATRHFPTLRDELGVMAFDTGFPVDFGRLRQELGPDVELFGGVEVPLLVGGTPEQVYERGRAILTSGVLAGGRFVYREGNNLPPNVPWANLAAFYRAALDFGQFAGG